jgi:bifunctional DNA-binding transcriptional regulator/antitoxin component of YhaV-PrlF toxin-antitoxin module
MRNATDVRVAPNGRMVLPRAARDALGVHGAGVVVVSVDGDEVKLTSIAKSIGHAQALYRAHATADQSSDAFLEARRLETVRDRAPAR